nr:YaaL family protein [Vibrio cholerae]
LVQFSNLKKEWLNDKSLLDKSFDPSDEVISEAKLSEAKYFFLFKEAKQRKINLLK